MERPCKLAVAAEELVRTTDFNVKDEAYAIAQKETVNSIKEVETQLKSIYSELAMINKKTTD